MLRTPRILIGEPEESICKLLCEICVRTCQDMGLLAPNITLETSGTNVWILVRNHKITRFDLVLVADDLPGISGTELFRRKNKICPDLPFVLLSTTHQPPEKLEDLHGGVFVPKPFDVAQMGKDIQRLLTNVLAEAQRTPSSP